LGCKNSRYQQVTEADPAKKLSADTVRHCVDYPRAVLCWIDMHPERSPAKRGVDHFDDSVRDGRDIRIGRHDGGEALEHLIGETRIRTSLVFSGPTLVVGRPGVVYDHIQAPVV
jgi:hypothetical protein